MSDFKKELDAVDAAIQTVKTEIKRLENTANVTRDFPSSMEFHRLLNANRELLVSMETARAAYEKNMKKE